MPVNVDWVGHSVGVIKSIGQALWSAITYPYRCIALLPDWIKIIILIVLTIISALILWRVWANKEAWKYLQT